MGASGRDSAIAYQPDLQRALEAAQARVLADGDYWWAVEGKPASECPNRPRTMAELFADQHVQESGTHSILDMSHVIRPGGRVEFGTVTPLTEAEAVELTGTATLTRAHVDVLDEMYVHVGFGRCATLYDAAGTPVELYFWGASGD